VQSRLAQLGDRDALREFGMTGTSAGDCESARQAERLAAAVAPARQAVDAGALLVLLRDQSPCAAPVRQQAVLLIARAGGPGTAQALLQVAMTDSAIAVRRVALRSLRAPLPAEARPVLEQILRNGTDVSLLEAAASAHHRMRREWGDDALREYARRPTANPIVVEHVHSLLATSEREAARGHGPHP
jgi:hypothetical protein